MMVERAWSLTRHLEETKFFKDPFIKIKTPFIKIKASNPKSMGNASSEGERWDWFAAYACLDKFLFSGKMLYACVVGDSTIVELENVLEPIAMDGVLTELPPDVRFTNPAEQCERIPIETLRRRRIVNPLSNVDFDAVNPKVMFKEERFWYHVPGRDLTSASGFHQDDPEKMVICSFCSKSKSDGTGYDEFVDHAKICHNCASNFCRKHYFSYADPTQIWFPAGLHQS